MGFGAFMAASESTRRKNDGGRRRNDLYLGRMPQQWQDTGGGKFYGEGRARDSWQDTDSGRNGMNRQMDGFWDGERRNTGRVYHGEGRENRENRRPERGSGYNRREMEDGWSEWEDDDDDDEEEGKEESKKYIMTKEKAVEWIENLENEDPAHPRGARWTMEEVKPLATKQGIKEGTTEFVEFWATMNMLYSDYYGVFKEHNLISADAFAKMAKAFLRDRDAMDHKLGRYYCAVVKKK